MGTYLDLPERPSPWRLVVFYVAVILWCAAPFVTAWDIRVPAWGPVQWVVQGVLTAGWIVVAVLLTRRYLKAVAEWRLAFNKRMDEIMTEF